MPQHALDYRRAGMLPPGYENATRGGGASADPGMIARHEYRTRQRQLGTAADTTATADTSRAAALLELRRRQLELLRVAGGY